MPTLIHAAAASLAAKLQRQRQRKRDGQSGRYSVEREKALASSVCMTPGATRLSERTTARAAAAVAAEKRAASGELRA